jgi:hypothetical protein
MKSFTRILMVALALLIAQIAVQAQTTGTVSGTVSDPNGAAVVGATVKLNNAATGAARTTVTGDKGDFGFNQIQPGAYSITVETTGFKKAVATDITVEVSKVAQVTIALEVGQASESVTVTSAQEVINTSSPSLTNVINTRQVKDLPLPTRNPMDLAALQAGIAVNGSGTRTASVAGLRGSATNVTQDGINAMDNFVKTDSFFALTSPSLNSIDEFSITTGTTGSDAGRGVAQVNMVTKSGSNVFHGSLFYLMRNSALEASPWFNNWAGSKANGSKVSPRPDEHQHFFGFTLGGPIYFLNFGEGVKPLYNGKDKSFFFFSYEGFREKFQATRNRTVLTPEARSGLFRYVGTNGVLQTVNLLAVGNQHALNPITLAKLNAMPASNNTLIGDGLNTAGALFNVVGSDPNDKYVFRLDQQLVKSERFGTHKLEFVYNRAHFILHPDTFNGIEAPFPGGTDAGQSSIRSLFTGAVHSDFGSATNIFRYGRQWAPVKFVRDSDPSAPFVVFGSVTTYDNTFMSQGRNTIVNQFSDNFVMPKGAHIISMGTDVQKVYADTFNDAGINTTINMGTNGSNPDGILAASFPFSVAADVTRARPIYADLVGNLASASATFNVTSATSGFVQGATRSRIFQQKQVAIFAQDQWRAKSSLTLSYGVRWEFQGVPTIPNGLAIQPNAKDLCGVSGSCANLFNPNAPAGPPPGVATLNFVDGTTGIPLYKNDWNNFAPFVGVAYSPHFDKGFLHTLFGAPGSSAFRAGYSISYLQDGFTVVSNALGTGTTNAGLIQSSANTTPTGVLTSGGVPLPALTFTMPLTDKQNFDINPGNGLWAIDPNLRVPYVQQWNFGFEREIFKDTAIEIRYTGNHAIKVLRAVDFNEVNIFENGFLDEFKRAQANLTLNGGSSFADPAHGGNAAGFALPILSRFFTGFANTSTSGFASSAFISNLLNNNVGTFANSLAFSNTYKANRQSATVGLPANFFVANPNAAFARLLTNDSMSNYNSLQIEFRRRFSQGLQFQADYTFSKSLTDATDAAQSQSDLVNFRTLRNKHLDYRQSNQDQTHRFVANGIYELPFGKGKSFLSDGGGIVDQIVGGWSIGAIVSWQTRPPFFISAGRTTFNSFNAGNNPAQLVGISFADFKKNLGIFRRPEGIYFINPAILNITTNPTTGRFVSSTLRTGLMAAPAPGTFGNFPLNSIAGPSYFNVDASIVKRFRVGERVRLELKTTMINMLNHPNFIYGTQNFDATNFGLIQSQSGGSRIVHFTGSMTF